MQAKFFLFLLFISLNIIALSQSNPFFNQPKIVPSSPEASSIFKVSDIPVDYTTGTANIDIPIFTINDGNLSVPISISYNTSGIKVMDIAGMIGLGWNLNFGGVINVQQQVSSPANKLANSAFKSEADFSNPDYSQADLFCKNIISGVQEKQNPEFYYHFGKYSGSFFYDINNNIHIKSHDQYLKITQTVTGFEIITPDGVKYSFYDKETVSGINAWTNVSAFFLSQITDLNSKKQIFFTYKQKPYYTIYQDSYSTYYVTSQGGGANYCNFPAFGDNYTRSPSSIAGIQIDKITFSNGYIKFYSQQDRLDIDPTRINQIGVFNNNNKEIKSIEFNQDYFVSMGGPSAMYNNRLRLSGLLIDDPTNNIPIIKYAFGYNTITPPAYESSNGKNCTGVDYWGYYNGREGQNGTIPQDVIATSDFSNYQISHDFLGDRKANPVFNASMSLTQIQYPTGGTVQFSYQTNNIPGYYLGDNVGGLRLQYIKYFDNINSTTPAKQQYFNYTKGSLVKPFSQNDYKYDKNKSAICDNQSCASHQSSCTNCRVDYVTRNVSSDPLGMDNYFRASPFYYEIEVYDMPNSGSGLKTIYYYDSTVDQYYKLAWSAPEYDDLYFVEKSWVKNGLLDSIETYKLNTDNSYNVVKKEIYLYQNSLESTFNVGLNVVLKNGWDFNGQYYDDWNECATAEQTFQGFMIQNAYNSFGIRDLTGKTVIDYDNNNNSMISTTKYTYNSGGFLTSSYNTNSKGQTVSDFYLYPTDKVSINNLTPQESNAIDVLVSKNILSPILLQDHYINSNLITEDRISYNTWINNGQSLTYPQQTQYKTLSSSSPYQLIQINDFYNENGSLLQYHEFNNFNNSYMWGYHNEYPVASVKNAAYNEIYTSSFEDSGWDANMGYDATHVHSGDQSGYINNTTGNEIFSYATIRDTFTTSPAAKYFHYSGWVYSKGSSAQVWLFTKAFGSTAYYSSADNIETTTTGKWVFLEKDYLVPANTQYVWMRVDNNGDNGGGKVWFDDLRFRPSNAQMTTYTYEPLIGMTSQNDENNRLTSFSYDGLGRLSLVRDKDSNILKKYLYAYQSPNPDTASSCVTDGNCSGPGKKCVFGYCQKAKRINTSTVKITTGANAGKWQCNYYYQWSDNTTDPADAVKAGTRNSEYNSLPCDITYGNN